MSNVREVLDLMLKSCAHPRHVKSEDTTMLIAGKMYEFQWRAHGARGGWTSYSVESERARVPSTLPVSRPFPPRVLPATKSGVVSLSFRVLANRGTVESCELQYRKKSEDEILWTIQSSPIVMTRHGAYFEGYTTLENLDENSMYELEYEEHGGFSEYVERRQ